MAADLTRICGPRSKHTPEREVYRHGTELGCQVKPNPTREQRVRVFRVALQA